VWGRSGGGVRPRLKSRKAGLRSAVSTELGEIRYAIEGAHWIADSVAMGAVPDPERTNSAPLIISAILMLVENRLHQLGRVLRGEENPAHLRFPGDSSDTATLEKWVLGLLEGRARASVP
jgi:hypothetical protein